MDFNTWLSGLQGEALHAIGLIFLVVVAVLALIEIKERHLLKAVGLLGVSVVLGVLVFAPQVIQVLANLLSQTASNGLPGA